LEAGSGEEDVRFQGNAEQLPHTVNAIIRGIVEVSDTQTQQQSQQQQEKCSKSVKQKQVSGKA
jgi:hypothetical protein